MYRPRLELDLAKTPVLRLNATDKIENAEMAAVVAGKPNLAVLTEIDLKLLADRFRFQRIVFEVARDVYDQMKPSWKGNKENLLAQVIQLTERFIYSRRLEINPPLFYQEELKRRVMLTLNMQRIVQHVFEQIPITNTESLEPVFDKNRPIRTTRTCCPGTRANLANAQRSHINFYVADSTWRGSSGLRIGSQLRCRGLG